MHLILVFIHYILYMFFLYFLIALNVLFLTLLFFLNLLLINFFVNVILEKEGCIIMSMLVFDQKKLKSILFIYLCDCLFIYLFSWLYF